MTFSLAARDPETGAFGMVISSSSPAVAARCMNLRPGVGAASSQNVTNPALGTAILDALQEGDDAARAIARAASSDPSSSFRQLTAVDAHGKVATFSGAQTLGVHHVAEGPGAVAAGNLLARRDVVDSMMSAYLESAAPSLEERLLDAFLGALAAGGEAGPVRSAGLAVVEDVPWRVTDLRVDDADDPAAELSRLVRLWMPLKRDYVSRALRPESAPSYGVPGDE